MTVAVTDWAFICYFNWSMKEDLPLPQVPSIDIVNGGRLAGARRKLVIASTYSLKPRLSLLAAWSPTALAWAKTGSESDGGIGGSLSGLPLGAVLIGSLAP
jgi:hypothetical protein